MKTLLIDRPDPVRLGELVTVGRMLDPEPDVLVLGPGNVPGNHAGTFSCREILGPNLVPGLIDWLKGRDYQAVILTATTIGTELAGPLAAALGGTAVTEVTGLEPQGPDGQPEITRPMYGGKASVRVRVTGRPLIMTVRRKYFPAAELTGTSPAEELDLVRPRVDLISETAEQGEGIPLEEAEVICTGGRGLGDAGGFDMLRELAGLLNGAVGASRGAVDEGWMEPSFQIGQTGKIVAPSIYLAVGVSGASQHLAGIAKANCVVAVNRDEEANIFQRAGYGVVSDYRKFIPALITALKEAG